MPHTCFASITPGLEEALNDELSDIGIRGRVQPGGVAFTANDEMLYAVHLHSRIAARVTVEVGRARVMNLNDLGARVRTGPWKRFITPGQAVVVKASLRESRLRRKDAAEKKVGNAINDALRGPRTIGRRPPREPVGVMLRLHDDMAVYSVEASGELLHRRGWRKATAKAPIRENLAAAMLRLAEWDPGEALVDPMCGSGTLPIEAATISMGLPPGISRRFDFERWPTFNAKLYKKVLAQAKKSRAIDDGSSPIWGSDRDEGALRASRSNARRAGVHGRTVFQEVPFGELEPPSKAGLLVLNPPYGHRVGNHAGPGKFFRMIGGVMKERWQGWRIAILLPNPKHLGALGLKLEEVATFKNGGLPVGLYVGEV